MPLVIPKPLTGAGTGSQTDYVRGSGTAVPTGVESLIEFNGLIMNDIYLVETYLVKVIDGLDDADVRANAEANPDDDGEEPDNPLYGGRTIILTGTIEAYSLEKLRDMQYALRTAFAPLYEMPLVFRTGNRDRDHYVMARKSAKTQMKETQTDNRWFRDFMITLRASNPRILSYAEKEKVRVFSFYDDFSANNANNIYTIE